MDTSRDNLVHLSKVLSATEFTLVRYRPSPLSLGTKYWIGLSSGGKGSAAIVNIFRRTSNGSAISVSINNVQTIHYALKIPCRHAMRYKWPTLRFNSLENVEVYQSGCRCRQDEDWVVLEPEGGVLLVYELDLFGPEEEVKRSEEALSLHELALQDDQSHPLYWTYTMPTCYTIGTKMVQGVSTADSMTKYNVYRS